MSQSIVFEEAENGCMEETHISILLRIVAAWGFDSARVELMESNSCEPFEIGGRTYYACHDVAFAVNGRGWTTDFETIGRAPEYDDEEVSE